jgi:exodeoxyribonuclease VII small subunit
MAKAIKKAAISYQELSAELTEVLTALQQEDVDIDDALKYYERGLELVTQLKDYLETAENTVVKLQAKFSSDA